MFVCCLYMLAMITNCVAITYIKHAYVYVYIYVILSCTAPSLSMYTYNKHSFMQCYNTILSCVTTVVYCNVT